MKNLLFIALGLIAAISVSNCVGDEMDINLTENNAGNLKVTIIDRNGDPIADQNVKLANYNDPLEERKTNNAGLVEFKDVLMGNYYIRIDDVNDGGSEYNVAQPIQVVNNVTKEYPLHHRNTRVVQL